MNYRPEVLDRVARQNESEVASVSDELVGEIGDIFGERHSEMLLGEHLDVLVVRGCLHHPNHISPIGAQWRNQVNVVPERANEG